MSAKRWGAAAVACAVLATTGLWLAHSRGTRSVAHSAPLRTPPGITLERANSTPDEVFADEHGMTLYVHLDTSGTPTADCEAECSAEHLAALAPPAARAAADWSLRATQAGQQWAYRGAALYRAVADRGIGDIQGGGARWRAAIARPEEGVELRTGILAREISDAGGTVLVDASGLTLYAYSGDSAGALSNRWLPLQAPAIAVPAAELSVTARSDGLSQWAFRGRLLFRFAEDTKPLDVNGLGLDPAFDAAWVRRSFMPQNVAIRRIAPWGNLLTTTEGLVLYQRDRVSTTNEGHDFREDHGSAALGRAFGTRSCDAACATTWHPLLAPANALPSGYWNVALRADGARQWTYKGFALYTFAQDVPGAALGNAIYDLAQVQAMPSAPDALPATGGSRADGLEVQGIAQRVGGGLSAMFWHAAIP